MNTNALTTITALAALTGIRSAAGITALAWTRGSHARHVMSVAAAVEMIADKTSLVGNRTDPLPLAGRAVLGAVVGALVASEQGHGQVIAGSVVGAVAAIAATHLAYQARKRLPCSNVTGGLLEDGLVLLLAHRYGRGDRDSSAP